ncbi:hypothetical protein AZOA_16550 [Azoarcus sp. Aa7]|nr:hypothetical protein [Azoarcus sp. Aa7]
MNKVIRIDEYRRRHSHSAEADGEIWSCGVCGESAWSVTTSGRLHCRHCDTTAANLQLANPAPAQSSAAEKVAHAPWNPLAASMPWWWAWAQQS